MTRIQEEEMNVGKAVSKSTRDEQVCCWYKLYDAQITELQDYY